MFKLLKSKLKSWLGKSQEKEIEIKKDKKKKSPKKEKKSKKNSIKKKKIKSDSKKEITQEISKEELEEPIKEEITQEISKEELEEPIKEEKIERKSFFSNILSKFTTSKIEKQQVEQIFEELEIILLEHNVALVGQESKSKDIKNKVIQSIKTAIEGVLINSPNLIEEIKKYEGTYTILFFGINGTGKTTSIAKIAK